jgi:hypothetical protein
MEDAPPANSTPNPNPNEGGNGANAAVNPPNPNEGGSGATVAVEIPNPIEGGRGLVSNIDTGSVHPNEGNPNPSKGGSDNSNKAVPNLASNKLNLYLSAKNVSNPNVLPNLFGGGSTTLPECGSFLVGGDHRLIDANLTSDICTGTSVTFSFDPNSTKSGCCEKKTGTCTVWVLRDQNFSPRLPCNGGRVVLK